MAIAKKYRAVYIENGVYHIYNRTNNKELLFRDDLDRTSFIAKMHHYLFKVLKPSSWNILPTHFHLTARVKAMDDIRKYLNSRKPNQLSKTEKKFLNGLVSLHELITHYFKRLFQSYSQSFNLRHNRNGNLFYKSYKRVEIVTDQNLVQTIVYVNANAQKHGLTDDFTKYPWSTWSLMLSKLHTVIDKGEIMRLFGGIRHFISIHKRLAKQYGKLNFPTLT